MMFRRRREEITVTLIRKTTFTDDDVFVYSTDVVLSQEKAELIKRTLRERLKVTNEIVVLGSGARLEIVHELPASCARAAADYDLGPN